MKRSAFNLSHEKLLTCNMGQLIPIMCEQLSPGDVWRQNTNLLLRTQPLMAPVMAYVDITVEHYAVPNRIMQTDWENFITGGLNGTEAPAAPTVTINNATGWAVSSLADYLGIPTLVDDITVSAFPFRAYSMICNEYYFDEQLQTQLVVSTGNGADTTTNTTLQSGCWNPDYFTKARSSPQLGTAVGLPLVGDAPVNLTSTLGVVQKVRRVSDHVLAPGAAAMGWDAASDLNNTGAVDVVIDPNGTLEADMSSVSAVDINELTEAAGIQRYKVKANRGARYPEWLKNFFRINPQDSRMQWPEYLGGGKATIQFSEVLQTAEGTDPVGELRGHGIATAKSNSFKYFAQEHCIIMTLMCVRPKAQYFQGIRRFMSYTSKYDYLIPDLANLGDQAITKGEIYAQGTAADAEVWGYTPKYDEYRHIPSTIAGEFKTTLDFWHMARDFSALPPLNADFVKSNPTDRIYATDAAQLQIRAIHKIKAKRPLPKHANQRLY